MPNYGGSPWGSIQEREILLEGVRSVSTAGHGGLMVTVVWATKHLSKAAIAAGRWYGADYICYEEDCDWAIPCYESPELLEAYRRALQDPEILTKDYCLARIKSSCLKYCRLAGIEPDPKLVEDMKRWGYKDL